VKQKFTWFDVLNTLFILLITLICLYPFWYVILISFSTSKGYYASTYHIIPNSFTIQNYMTIFNEKTVFTAFLQSCKITLLGTAVSMVLTAMAGYVFSKKDLPGIKAMYGLVIFSMYFGGGMVPMYLLVNSLNMRNTIWALTLTGAISTFNVVLARNYFLSLPSELEESAKIDGATEFTVFRKIIVPLSMPILATLTLFYAVAYWNDYMKALLYMSDEKMFPLPLIIRSILSKTLDQAGGTEAASERFSQGINMATVVVSILPVMIAYPWLQKYFVGGIMIGAVKG